MRVVVVEEHHEAFFVWHYARAQGWLGPGPVALVHADELADMGVPRLRRPLRDIRTPEDAAWLTYDDLAINNYIWPAVYQGFFDEIVWLRARHSERTGGSRFLRIVAESDSETAFRTSNQARGGPIGAGGKTVRYCPASSCDSLTRRNGCVLSVDLTYFGGDPHPAAAWPEIEITECAYREFLSSPYHFTRLVFHCKVDAVRRGHQFYLTFNEGVPSASGIRPRDVVMRRIDEFAALLVGVEPDLTVISRSCHCGYVEAGNADFATSYLLSHLERIAPLETYRLDELLAGYYPVEAVHA